MLRGLNPNCPSPSTPTHRARTPRRWLQAQVAKYRSKGRLPALSYLYQGKTAICRCAQPMAGVQSKRSQYDELLLQKIWEANPSGKTVKIVDTRPKINAIANKV